MNRNTTTWLIQYDYKTEKSFQKGRTFFQRDVPYHKKVTFFTIGNNFDTCIWSVTHEGKYDIVEFNTWFQWFCSPWTNIHNSINTDTYKILFYLLKLIQSVGSTDDHPPISICPTVDQFYQQCHEILVSMISTNATIDRRIIKIIYGTSTWIRSLIKASTLLLRPRVPVIPRSVLTTSPCINSSREILSLRSSSHN